MKRILSVLLIMVFVLSFQMVAFAEYKIPAPPTENIFVNDYANVLSDKTEKELITKADKLVTDTKGRVIFVTIPSLNGDDIDSLGNRWARTWKIGDKELDNAVLVLLSLSERKIRIEVSTRLEGRITDSKAAAIRTDVMGPYLKVNDFDKAFLAGLNALDKEIRAEYQNTMDNKPVDSKDKSQTNRAFMWVFFFLAFLILMAFGIVMYSEAQKEKKRLKELKEWQEKQSEEIRRQQMIEEQNKKDNERLNGYPGLPGTSKISTSNTTLPKGYPGLPGASKSTSNPVSYEVHSMAAASIIESEEEKRTRRRIQREQEEIDRRIRREEEEEEEERDRRRRRDEEEEEERRRRDSDSSSSSFSSNSNDDSSSSSSTDFGGGSSFDGGGSSGDF